MGVWNLLSERIIIMARASLTNSRRKLPVGVVFSTTGPYRTIGRELLDGAMLAISEVNKSGKFDFSLNAIARNPGGELAEYRKICEGLLASGEVRHVVGCYTSSSRKEVIPIFEKRDGLLWYPSHYEGFESCNNVVYTGAAPNQHIVPLTGYMLQTYGDRAYCIGSNYIWAWENNRIMREIVRGCGGTVLAEKYLSVDSIDVDHVVQEIMTLRPSFVFSSLIGVSSYAFMERFYQAKKEHGRLASAEIPMCSSTLSEPELFKISPASAIGHIASSVYFQSRKSAANEKFVNDYTAGYGPGRVTSADAEAAYNAIHLMANAVQKAGSADIEAVKAALATVEIEAPQGKVWVDQDNNHCFLTPSLGMSNSEGGFDIVWSAEGPVKPDPYLVNFDAREFRKDVSRKNWGTNAADGAHLRVVK